jgi:hypothetical protein
MLIGHSVADAAGRILAIDEGICDFFQRPKRAIIGMTYQQLTHPTDRLRSDNAVLTLKVGGTPLELRKRYLLPDGTDVVARVQLSRLDTGPDAERLIGTLCQAEKEYRPPSPEGLWRTAARMSSSAAFRRRLLGEDLFIDYPLAILLEIYVAEAEGRALHSNELGDALRLPCNPVRRWAAVLRSRGLIENCGHDAVQLTALGLRNVELMLESWTVDRPVPHLS